MDVGCQLDERCQCEILKPLERRRRREQRCLAHSLVGTPNYIAPEVLLRSGNLIIIPSVGFRGSGLNGGVGGN